MHAVMRRFLGILAASVLAISSNACSASAPDSVGAGSSAATSGSAGTVAPSPTTLASPTTAAPPGGPVPSQLLGTWIGKSDTVPPGREVMTLNEVTYRLESADGASAGSVVVNGDEIDFFSADQCGLRLPKGVGRYHWTLVGGILHFKPLDIDPCGRAAVLSDADYHR
jgi:hypothetical protein